MEDSEILLLILWIVFAVVVAAFAHKRGRSSTAWLLVGLLVSPRRFAYGLALRNKVLLLDADNFAKMAKTPDAEKEQTDTKNELRHGVAPAMLRDAITAAFGGEKGGQVMWSTIIGFASSNTCRKCWSKDNTLNGSRAFKCTACGHTDDRESNVTGNLMDEYVRKNGSTFSSKKPVAERLAAAKAAGAAA